MHQAIHSRSAPAGYQPGDGWPHRWGMTTGRLVCILGLLAACGLTAQEPIDTNAAIEGESLLEEVYEDRILLLQDTLFLRQEQLEAANFTRRQLEQSVAGLTDTLGQVQAQLQQAADSLYRVGILYDRATADNRRHIVQLSVLSDSLAYSFHRGQELRSRYDSLLALDDSVMVLLGQAQSDLLVADSLERAFTDTVAALKVMLQGLEGKLFANQEGLSGMYEQLKNALMAVDEEVIDSTTDAQYLAHLRGMTDYKVKSRGFTRLFSGAGGEELARYKLDEFRQYLRWSELRGHTPEALNLLADNYYARGDKVRGALTYLKTVFLYSESEAGLHAQGQLEERLGKDDEIGRLYYEVALNSDSMNIGDEYFYRYLHFLDYVHTLQHIDARRYFLAETQQFLALYPAVFQADQLHVWIAQTYHALGEFHTEILTYMKIRSMYPESEYRPQVTFALAKVTTSDLEMHELGAQRYDDFLVEFPDNERAPAALMAQAQLYETRLKRPKMAADLYRHLADTYQADPLAPAALFGFANLLRNKLASPAGALAVYEEILSTYGEDRSVGIPALEGLAAISKKTRQYDAAVSYYLDIFQRYPEDNEKAVDGILKAADIYQSDLKNIDAAIHTLHLVLDNYPKYRGYKAVQKRVQKLQKKKG